MYGHYFFVFFFVCSKYKEYNWLMSLYWLGLYMRDSLMCWPWCWILWFLYWVFFTCCWAPQFVEFVVNLRIEEEPHVNDEIQPIEKFVESKYVNDFQGFGALHNMSSTSTTNCFAPMFKWEWDKCVMNCNSRLRRVNETLTNWHWMSSVKKSRIRRKWLCMTCSNNKVWTPNLCQKDCVLKHVRTLSGRLLYESKSKIHRLFGPVIPCTLDTT